jgi:hypothetical protein
MKKFTHAEVKTLGLNYLTDVAITKLNRLVEKVGQGVEADSAQVALEGDNTFFSACSEIQEIVIYHSTDLSLQEQQDIATEIENRLNIRFVS